MLNIKKADIVLCIAITVIGILMTVLIAVMSTGGSDVVITVNGKVHGIYSLDEDQTITVKQNNHINKININSGKVSMTFSDCKNQVCVKHKEISKTSETITCLPNRVMITIRSDDKGGYDAISN